MRKELSNIDESIRNAYEEEKECEARLLVVNAALNHEVNSDQRALLVEKQLERFRALTYVENRRRALDGHRKEAVETLKDCEAHFARAEAMKFCKSSRYIKNPLNMANALAGLPFIGWRQSAKRCQQWKCEIVGGNTYQLFEVVRQLVESWDREISLTEHAREWLRTNRRYRPNAQAELRNKFLYLRRSISEVMKTNPRRKALPYLIANEYVKRVSSPTNVEKLFEEEERIV